jgi:dTDP-4-dehydrorhamnose reductase
VGDLSQAITRLIETRRYGTHHLTNSGITSWHGFAEEIVRLQGLPTLVDRQSTAEAARPAPRPAYSPLENWGWKVAGEAELPTWQDALARFLGTGL